MAKENRWDFLLEKFFSLWVGARYLLTCGPKIAETLSSGPGPSTLIFEPGSEPGAQPGNSEPGPGLVNFYF